MPRPKSPARRNLALFALIALQSLCAVFFLNDAINDIIDTGGAAVADLHLIIETIAAVVMLLGVALEVQYLLHLLRQQARMARGLSVAQGALQDVIEGYFAAWGLTAAEQDVAGFTLKGYSIAEVARFRGSAEGTVKAHLNAIYRKAGVTGRGALVSLMIEDLMGEPLVDTPPAQKRAARDQGLEEG